MTIESAGLGDIVHPKSESKRILQAAQQFEALLIGQMLKSALDSGGSLGTADGPGSALIDMSAEQFAQTLASKGGLGIAKMVATGLESHATR